MSAQKRTMSDVGTGILGFVGMSALAGVLVTAAVTPALAVTGMAANNGIAVFENLPGYLKIDELAQKSTIYATNPADGTPTPLASFFTQNREEVAWESISQYVKDAAIAGEDPRFYEHGGVDIQGTLRGAVSTVTGAGTQGGSSITQQYVKNVLIQQGIAKANTVEEEEAAFDAATEVSASRKLKEMRYAISIEKQYAKDDILRGYLNIAGFGGRVYGIESAAQYYFDGTHAADLTLAQAASLIAIVNHPEKFRLDYPDDPENGVNTVDKDGNPKPYGANKDRRDYILGEMLKLKKITKEEYDAAVATPVQPVLREPSTGCQSDQGTAFFCDYVTWVIRHHYDLPDTEEDEGLAMLEKGGLDIYTTLDLDLQYAANTAIAELVPFSSPELDVGSVAVSVQPGTGRILAMAQNKHYSNDPDVLADPSYSAVNYNTDQPYGGSSGFQPGSTYKVFTVAEWLAEGHSLNESVDGRRKSNWGTFRDSCNGPQSDPSWNPRNDEGGNGGSMTALTATQNSTNTGFVGMAKELDLCGIRKMAESFGVHRADGGALEQGPASILGTNEVAPLSMAEAFAGVGANGIVCKPVAIDKIVDGEGAEIPVPSGDCAQKVDPAVTSGMAYAMQRVMTAGTATTSNGNTDPWVPMAGKTGTTDNAEATWMSGTSTKVATVVGVFNASGHVNLRDTYFDAGQAAQIRHQIWPRIMSVANGKYGGDEFPTPADGALKAVQAEVPNVVGLSLDAAQQALEAAGFGFEHAGDQDSNLPAGTVSGQDPSGLAAKGTTIRVFTSNGSMSGVPNVVGQTQAEAEATLRAAGFRVDTRTQDTTEATQVGVVISQDPAGGGFAKPGDKVSIVVGKLGAGAPGAG